MRNILSHILVLAVGVGVGWGVVRYYPGLPPETPAQESAPTVKEAEQLSARIAELERELSEYKVRVSDAAKQIAAYEATHTSQKNTTHPTTESSETDTNPEGEALEISAAAPATDAAKWRISAIEKFVPLSSDQKERLAEAYRAKSEGRKSETLEEILGNESAQYYREQVNSAFSRMRAQELEKEIVFTSRKLQLSDTQEGKLREVYNAIEKEISLPTSQGGDVSPQERVKRMVEEGKRRAALRSERTKEVLSPQQYQEYLKSEAESPEADMQVFHDSGE